MEAESVTIPSVLIGALSVSERHGHDLKLVLANYEAWASCFNARNINSIPLKTGCYFANF